MDKKIEVLVWDLPTRLFHWFFALGVAISVVCALSFDEHSVLFSLHAISGLIVAFVLVLRIIWGFIGSRYARFNSFTFTLADLLGYFKGLLVGGEKRYIGHNPGSAYATFGMLTIMLGLTVTGIILGCGGEWIEEIHEFLAYAMISLIIIHIVGILFHIVRHRENIATSMINGKKRVEAQVGGSSSCSIAAMMFLVLIAAWVWGLFIGYNAANLSVKLPLFGVNLQIGETGHEKGFDLLWHGKDNEDEDD